MDPLTIGSARGERASPALGRRELAGLKAWSGWLELKKMELAQIGRRPRPSAGQRPDRDRRPSRTRPQARGDRRRHRHLEFPRALRSPGAHPRRSGSLAGPPLFSLGRCTTLTLDSVRRSLAPMRRRRGSHVRRPGRRALLPGRFFLEAEARAQADVAAGERRIILESWVPPRVDVEQVVALQRQRQLGVGRERVPVERRIDQRVAGRRSRSARCGCWPKSCSTSSRPSTWPRDAGQRAEHAQRRDLRRRAEALDRRAHRVGRRARRPSRCPAPCRTWRRSRSSKP